MRLTISVRRTDNAIDEAIAAYGMAFAALHPIRLQLWDERGLTLPQLRLLFLLRERQPRTVSDLSEAMGVRPATMTGLTDRVLRHGLIERRADPSDRRVVGIALTESGETTLSEIEQVGRAYLTRIFERLPRESLAGVTAAFADFAQAAAEEAEERARRTSASGPPGPPVETAAPR
jgi:MarR family transcriptional regulator, organic hydroperoxide resistance regulator